MKSKKEACHIVPQSHSSQAKFAPYQTVPWHNWEMTLPNHISQCLTSYIEPGIPSPQECTGSTTCLSVNKSLFTDSNNGSWTKKINILSTKPAGQSDFFHIINQNNQSGKISPNREKGGCKMDKPVTPALRRSGNFSGNSISHLVKQSSLQVLSIGHESLGIGVFLVEVVNKIRVPRVSHPMVRIFPCFSMCRDSERDFLCQRRGLWREWKSGGWVWCGVGRERGRGYGGD